MAANCGKIRALRLEGLISWRGMQGLANYGPQAKSSPLPVSVNKVLLRPSRAYYLHIYGHFHTIRVELRGCNRDPLAYRAPSIYSLVLCRKRLVTPGGGHCLSEGTDVPLMSSVPASSGPVLCSVEP